jgi:hypothetical protein
MRVASQPAQAGNGTEQLEVAFGAAKFVPQRRGVALKVQMQFGRFSVRERMPPERRCDQFVEQGQPILLGMG